jgi:DNA-binding Lrp family transcriptional regulator
MLESEIRVLEELRKSEKSITSLASAIGKSVSWTSELVTGLEEKGLVRKDRKVRLESSYESSLLMSLMEKYSLRELLKGDREEVLRKLSKPKTIADLEEKYSKSLVYEAIKCWKTLGIIKKTEGGYVLSDDEVESYLKVSGSREPLVKVYYSNDEEIVRIPRERHREGVPTAFSKFSSYGVDYYPNYQYLYNGGKKLTIEDVLAHALLAAEDKKQMNITCIFYLKNKRKIDNSKVRKITEKYGCSDQWIDLLAYIDGRKLEANRFLPWNEFVEKAREYEVNPPLKYQSKRLEDNLKELGKELDSKVDSYLIGGANLILRGLKDTTKDLDLVLSNKRDFGKVKSSLQKLGFQEIIKPEKTYEKMNPSTILKKEGSPRWDIFVKQIAGTLYLTKTMRRRSRHFRDYGNLSIHLISLGDIFLFKSVTDREGDLEDAALAARMGEVHWPELLEEIRIQEKKTERFPSFAVLDTLDILKERHGIETPINRKLISHCLENALLTHLKEPKTIRELRRDLGFPEHQIYNKLRKLEDQGKIQVDRTGKLNKYSKKE